MEYIATQKFIRISPKKMRLLVASMKDMNPMKAIEVLPYVGKRSAEPLLKVIKTAVANARVQGADVEKLIFKEIQIGEGPRLKRGNPVSRGRFHPIKKRMSHIRVIVETKEEKSREAGSGSARKGVKSGTKN